MGSVCVRPTMQACSVTSVHLDTTNTQSVEHVTVTCTGHTRQTVTRCKDRVRGHNCEICKGGYWNLDQNNPLGCEDCSCYQPGTVGGFKACDIVLGQCVCKPYTDNRRCDQCKDGTYNLQAYNVFGCEDCMCDVGGSSNLLCDKDSGQCTCRPRVVGRTCNQPLTNHYFPTLYQHQYEMEDGRTAYGGPVRYNFDPLDFPGYSWRGYAILSKIQDEVLVDVDIAKPSLYRLIFRYVNPGPNSIHGEVTLTPESSADVRQTSFIVFQATSNPEFATVSGRGLTFVLNRWTISLKSTETIFVIVEVREQRFDHLGNLIDLEPVNMDNIQNIKKIRDPMLTPSSGMIPPGQRDTSPASHTMPLEGQPTRTRVPSRSSREARSSLTTEWAAQRKIEIVKSTVAYSLAFNLNLIQYCYTISGI